MRLVIILFFASLTCQLHAQLERVTELSSRIEETSGLLMVSNRLVTHNDSGGSTKLYEIDQDNGEVSRSVDLRDVKLRDWEDLCADDEFIYLGDFGNNLGERTNLLVYKIPIEDYLSDNDKVEDIEEIPFRYADQSDFSSNRFETNFDAETIMNFGEDLLIFSKNWGNGKTKIYKLSKTETDEQELEPLVEYDVDGLITGGVFDPNRKLIMLCGYKDLRPFIIEMRLNANLDIQAMDWEKTWLDTDGYSTQIEGITLDDNGNFILSGEKTFASKPTLYKLAYTTSTQQPLTPIYIDIYPNPTRDWLYINMENYVHSEIFDVNGKRYLASKAAKIELKDFPKGLYFIRLTDESGKLRVHRFIKN